MKEIPLETLDTTELLMQWRVMKALGYRSLFDPDFRREMKNPYRRILYYRLVSIDGVTEKKFIMDIAKGVIDRLTFAFDPELYRKVKAEEQKHELLDPEVAQEKQEEADSSFERAKKKHVPMSQEQIDKVKDLLLNANPRHSMTT